MNSRCLTSSPQNRSQTIKARYLGDLDRHFEGSSGGVAGTTPRSVFGGGRDGWAAAMVFGGTIIGVQKTTERSTEAVTPSQNGQILTRDDGFGCATPWATAELMEATHHRRTGTSHETTGTYKTNCVAQTTQQRRDSSGYSPVDDGRTAREGVSVLSNSNPWIGFQLGVFSYATGTSSQYLLSETVPYGAGWWNTPYSIYDVAKSIQTAAPQ
ncbi:hypothetical protein V491_04235 [Pseudogymnoascus sp. VKM F-3775]|nr:hypothetical protein V491_04235 [Pseudogymnoascus sp. VKM F-3775]